jgi:hypothetical protein
MERKKEGGRRRKEEEGGRRRALTFFSYWYGGNFLRGLWMPCPKSLTYPRILCFSLAQMKSSLEATLPSLEESDLLRIKPRK